MRYNERYYVIGKDDSGKERVLLCTIQYQKAIQRAMKAAGKSKRTKPIIAGKRFDCFIPVDSDGSVAIVIKEKLLLNPENLSYTRQIGLDFLKNREWHDDVEDFEAMKRKDIGDTEEDSFLLPVALSLGLAGFKVRDREKFLKLSMEKIDILHEWSYYIRLSASDHIIQKKRLETPPFATGIIE